MAIMRLEVSGFRNLTSIRLAPSPSIKLFYGENASGKTSLLEAIFFLSNARSFRTGKVSNLIQRDTDCFTLFAENTSITNINHRIGIRRCRSGEDVTRIDGENLQKRSSLLKTLPLQVISPESLSLLIESAEKRRAFIDWGLFHVEQSFRMTWLNYSRALRQRNALLRSGIRTALDEWSEIFINHSETLTSLRKQYVEKLAPYFEVLVKALLPDVSVSITYQQGWVQDQSLRSILHDNVEQDLRLKYTTAGPQRADLTVRHEGRRASEVLSRGQMKLVVFALLIAQMEAMSISTHIKPVLLVDDLAAELDPRHRAFILERIKLLETQSFVTTPDLSLFDVNEWSDRKLFHVEHGEIKEVV